MAVFLDRDGVINELIYHREAGVIDTPFTLGQFRLLPGVVEAIRILNNEQIKVIVVSNQPGIAKNHFTRTTLNSTNRKMKSLLARGGAHIDSIYYCLHHPEAVKVRFLKVCNCRKPAPGLILKAARKFQIDTNNSYMVGDNLSDIKAGRAAGCKTILIGKHKCELCRLMQEENAVPDFIAANLLEAVERIVQVRSK